MTGLVRVPMQSKKWPPGTKTRAGVVLESYYTISLHGWIHQVFVVKRKDGKVRKVRRIKRNG